MLACICGGVFETIVILVMSLLGSVGLICRDCTFKIKRKP